MNGEHDNDSMRDKLDLSLYCSIHRDERLNMSSEFSKVGGSSAYEVNLKVMVKPCRLCQGEFQRFKNAVSIVIRDKENG